MENKVLFEIGKTKHFANGEYKLKEDNVGITGSIYEYHDIISVQFNQLKGKLFNLIEASLTDEKQREAVKGLVKGFCNHNYNNLIGDIEGWIQRMGFSIEKNIPITSPLERVHPLLEEN